MTLAVNLMTPIKQLLCLLQRLGQVWFMFFFSELGGVTYLVVKHLATI